MTVIPPPATRAPAVATSREELGAALVAAGSTTGEGRRRVGLVPTMGALHAGHAALMDEARTCADMLVVSIFVNPLQFAPGEDFDRYPRTLSDDLRLCAERGVDVVFAPSVDVLYPGGEPQVSIEPGPLAESLDGAARPDHFRGVLTVVAKLFGLVQPDVAVFGQKDYQQLVLVRRMVSDLCLPVEVRGAETVRDPDGLALSSRNRYLSADERSSALALSRSMRAGAGAAWGGPEEVLAQARKIIDDEPDVVLDYLVLRAPDLSEPRPAAGASRLLVAARVGTTRLIDNAIVHLP